MAKNDETPEVTLEDFVVPQKVEAFAEAYAPASSQTMATEVFDDARLRSFFRAFPIAKVGDPLSVYVAMLEKRGFRMRVSIEGEPAIFANTKVHIDEKLLRDPYF